MSKEKPTEQKQQLFTVTLVAAAAKYVCNATQPKPATNAVSNFTFSSTAKKKKS